MKYKVVYQCVNHYRKDLEVDAKSMEDAIAKADEEIKKVKDWGELVENQTFVTEVAAKK